MTTPSISQNSAVILSSYTLTVGKDSLCVQVVKSILFEDKRRYQMQFQAQRLRDRLVLATINATPVASEILSFSNPSKNQEVLKLLIQALFLFHLEHLPYFENISLTYKCPSFYLQDIGFYPINSLAASQMQKMRASSRSLDYLESRVHFVHQCEMEINLNHPTKIDFNFWKEECQKYYDSALAPYLIEVLPRKIIYDFIFSHHQTLLFRGPFHTKATTLLWDVTLEHFCWNVREDYVLRAYQGGQEIGACDIANPDPQRPYLHITRLDNYTHGTANKIQGAGTLLLTWALIFTNRFPHCFGRMQLGSLPDSAPFYFKLGFTQKPWAEKLFLHFDLNQLPSGPKQNWIQRISSLLNRS